MKILFVHVLFTPRKGSHLKSLITWVKIYLNKNFLLRD